MKKEFLEYIESEDSSARYQRSYKLVLLKAIFTLKDTEGNVPIPKVIAYFRRFYMNRKARGLKPDINVDNTITNIERSTDRELFALIAAQPLKVIKEKDFVELVNKNNMPTIRIPKELINELDNKDEQDILALLDKKISRYYYKIDSLQGVGNNEEAGSIPSDPEAIQKTNMMEETEKSPYEVLKERIYEEFPHKILIGDIEINDQEYRLLVQLLKNSYNDLISSNRHVIRDPLFATALVQIGIRSYDGNFWSHVSTSLGVANLPGTHQGWIGKSFIETLKFYNKEYDKESDRIQNILMQGFVSDHFLDSFFNFLFLFYRLDLNRDITGNVDDEIDILADAIANNLTTKRMNLIRKHTSIAFQCHKSYCRERIITLIKLIDKSFWSQSTELEESNRIIKSLNSWRIESKVFNSDILSVGNKGLKHKGRARFPYLRYDDAKKQFDLFLPSRLTKEYLVSDLFWKVQTNKGQYKVESSYIEAATGIKTEETNIIIDSKELLGDFIIELFDQDKKLFHFIIKHDSVRLFDEEGDFINMEAIPIGHVVAFSACEDMIDSEAKTDTRTLYGMVATYFKFQKGDVVYLPDNRATTIGKKMTEGLLERGLVEDAFLLRGADKIPVYSSVPILLVKMDRSQLHGTAIMVNGERFKLANCSPKEIIINELNAKYGYLINLSSVGSTGNKIYDIEIDIPNRKKILIQYGLIKGFNFVFEDAPYIFKQRGTVAFNPHLNISSCAGEKIEGEYKWNFQINERDEFLKLQTTEQGENLDVFIEIPVLRWKIDEGDWHVDRPEDIWHAHFPHLIHIKFPENEIALKFEDSIYNAEPQSQKFIKNRSDECFICDMTKFHSWIGRDKAQRKLSMEYSKDTIPFLYVITKSIIQSKMISGDFEKGLLIGDFDIIGKANYCVDVKYQGNRIIEKEPIIQGRFKSKAELGNGVYHVTVYEYETGKAFGIYKYKSIDDFDIELQNPTKLNGKQLNIKNIQKSLYLKKEYVIDQLEYQGDLTYSATLHVNGHYGLKRLYNIRVEFIDPKNMRYARINLIENGDVVDFVYDDINNILVHEEEKGLPKSERYRRYWLLDDDTNIFEISVVDNGSADICQDYALQSHDCKLLELDTFIPDTQPDTKLNENSTTNYTSIQVLVSPDDTISKDDRLMNTDPMDTPISNTGLSPLVYNALKKSGIHKITDLKKFIQEKGVKGLNRIQGLKADRQEEVKDIIRKFNLWDN